MLFDGLFSWINSKVPPDTLTKLVGVKSVPTQAKATSALQSVATLDNAKTLYASGNLKKDSIAIGQSFLQNLLK